jgi:hypothetical protein
MPKSTHVALGSPGVRDLVLRVTLTYPTSPVPVRSGVLVVVVLGVTTVQLGHLPVWVVVLSPRIKRTETYMAIGVHQGPRDLMQMPVTVNHRRSVLIRTKTIDVRLWVIVVDIKASLVVEHLVQGSRTKSGHPSDISLVLPGDMGGLLLGRKRIERNGR